jgi:hypothetical protein
MAVKTPRSAAPFDCLGPVLRTAATFLFFLGICVGCRSDPTKEVASRIRAEASPIVREVVYRDANFLDPAVVDVYLRAGTSRAQADALWCDVIAPGGGSFVVALWTDEGSQLTGPDEGCSPVPS